jgi:hypothetical protein
MVLRRVLFPEGCEDCSTATTARAGDLIKCGSFGKIVGWYMYMTDITEIDYYILIHYSYYKMHCCLVTSHDLINRGVHVSPSTFY